MGSLVYVELLGNPRYRKFLHRAFPWVGHVGIKHFFMAPLVAAAKDTRSGIVDFFVTEETAWTTNVWIRPLLVRNVDRLMYKLPRVGSTSVASRSGTKPGEKRRGERNLAEEE
jgi:hypothetical protein